MYHLVIGTILLVDKARAKVIGKVVYHHRFLVAEKRRIVTMSIIYDALLVVHWLLGFYKGNKNWRNRQIIEGKLVVGAMGSAASRACSGEIG